MTASIFPPVDPRLLSALREKDAAVIIAHRNPDGDAVFSSLAMREILQTLGKECLLLNEGEFLRSDIKAYEKEFLRSAPQSFLDKDPLVVVLDCSTPDRPGEPFKALRSLKTVCIDHHSAGEPFTEEGLSYIVPLSPSTTLLVDQVRRELDVELTPAMAEYLYIGFATDTGFFHFLSEKTAPESLRRVSDFTAMGVSPYDIYDTMHDGRALKDIKDAASIILSARPALDGAVIFARQGLDMGEERLSDGIYATLLETEGVKAVVFLKERKDGLEIGFRSKHRSGIDVGALAATLGGGGHIHAAGATVQMSPEEAERMLEKRFSELLDQ